MRTPLGLALLLLAGAAGAQTAPSCPATVALIKPFEKACGIQEASASVRAHWDAVLADPSQTKLACFERAVDKAPALSACQRTEIKRQIGLAAMRLALRGSKD